MKRLPLILSLIVCALAAPLLSLRTEAQVQRPVTASTLLGVFNVKAYGATGDGSTDDYTAINNAMTAAAAAKGELFIPRTANSYAIGTALTIPTGLKIRSDGATIKVLATMGEFDRAITIDGVADVTIQGLNVDGNKAAFATATEQRHGVYVTGNASNITLRDLYLYACKGDGVYIGSGDGTTTPTNVYAENVRCDANHRQGMSISSGRHLTFVHCRFTNTSGTAPQAGVDIEPNSSTAICENITFEACTMSGNAGAGLLIDWPTSSSVQKGIHVLGCFIHGNTGSGIAADQPKGLLVRDCEIYSNTDRGITLTDNIRGAKLLDNTIYLNGMQGIFVLAQSGTKFCTGLVIRGSRLYDNSATVANAVDAIRIDWALGATDGLVGAIVEGNNCANQNTANQRYAITTDGATQMTDLILSNNFLKGCATGVSVLSDAAASRRVRGNAGLADN